MGIFKRIKELESDIITLRCVNNVIVNNLWMLQNLPKFKSGDECVYKHSIACTYEGRPIYSEDPVFILSEKSSINSERIYYVSDSLPRDPIHVIEANEAMLTLIKK